MPTAALSAGDLDSGRQLLREQLPEGLADLAEVRDDPAGVERLACGVLVPFGDPELPLELRLILIDVLEELATRDSALLLEALALLAPAELGRPAEAAADRLRARGIDSRAPRGLGALQIVDARRRTSADGDAVAALLGRPSGRGLQEIVVLVERKATGGALAGGFRFPPVDGLSDEDGLRDVAADGDHEPISAEVLAGTLMQAAQRTRDLGLDIPRDLALCLPVLARAVFGRPDALGELAVDGDSHPLDVDPEDEESLEALTEALLDGLERFVTAQRAHGDEMWRSGHFVAEALLGWKGAYADGRLGCWVVADVDDFLVEHWPRKITADEETLADAPACVAGFLAFLDAKGLLAGDDLDQLQRRCRAIAPRFARVARDRSRFGMAKGLAARMADDGVDLSDADQVAAWIEDFNAWPGSDRDRALGPASGIPPSGAPRAHRPKTAERRAQRRQAKAARRRNRRR
jgi:hypothetical protein